MSIEPSGAPTQPVTDSLSAAFHDDTAAVLELAGKAAAEYVAALSAAPAAPRRQHEDDGREVLARFAGPLPERGMGAEAAVRQLTEHALPQAVRSSGPRYFHFVTGGTTPAALAADWLTSTIDQNAAAWVCSPMATHLETVALGWLKELFGLPAGWGAVTTTGGTMANFTGLAAARRYWAARHGVDVDVDGLARLPPMPVFGSGFAHAVRALFFMRRRRVRSVEASSSPRGWVCGVFTVRHLHAGGGAQPAGSGRLAVGTAPRGAWAGGRSVGHRCAACPGNDAFRAEVRVGLRLSAEAPTLSRRASGRRSARSASATACRRLMVRNATGRWCR